jgi:hypothetical protein
MESDIVLIANFINIRRGPGIYFTLKEDIFFFSDDKIYYFISSFPDLIGNATGISPDRNARGQDHAA